MKGFKTPRTKTDTEIRWDVTQKLEQIKATIDRHIAQLDDPAADLASLVFLTNELASTAGLAPVTRYTQD